ncbi:MAG: patatin-like phospholipase family protein [Myxococcales bacterium]|nr:patatin-like phospholipase family protein [Myxococcales bacterium]
MQRPPRIAFVGSGGAARGIAHLGILRAFEELGIKPSIFVGASAGAIVSSLYGQGVPLDTLIDAYRAPWQRKTRGPHLHEDAFFGLPSLGDLTNPGYLLSGLFSIDKLESHLRKRLPSNDFKSVPSTILVTACDIDGRGREVFGRGYREDVPISQAVAAICCVPGLFRPYRIGDRYFVDGEVVRTLSLDLAVDAGADIVVVSNIYRPLLTRPERPSIARRGGVKVLEQALSIILSEKERRGIELFNRLHPHVTFIDVSPDIGHIGFLNRFASRQLLLRGYRQAMTELMAARSRGVFAPRDDKPASSLH